jgi:hypothetical protein
VAVLALSLLAATGDSSSLIFVALIGMPANLLIAWATYRKASSADNAVNHRVNGTTISVDVLDMRHELREQGKQLAWLTRMVSIHMKEHASGTFSDPDGLSDT